MHCAACGHVVPVFARDSVRVCEMCHAYINAFSLKAAVHDWITTTVLQHVLAYPCRYNYNYISISGSSILQIIQQHIYTNTDLDIYIEISNLNKIKLFDGEIK